VWEALAYAARYGMQSLSELRALPMADLLRFVREVSTIVREENTAKEGR
jgi:hypothetical protein